MILDNVCIFCIIVVVGMELVDVYFLSIVRIFFLRKEVYILRYFIFYVVLFCQVFVYCGKFFIVVFWRSLGCVLVLVWLIVFLNQLLIMVLVSYYFINKLIRCEFIFRQFKLFYFLVYEDLVIVFSSYFFFRGRFLCIMYLFVIRVKNFCLICMC